MFTLKLSNNWEVEGNKIVRVVGKGKLVKSTRLSKSQVKGIKDIISKSNILITTKKYTVYQYA